MDGIPESVAIGDGLLAGYDVGIAIVAAICLSSIPGSLSAATLMRQDGRTRRYILGLWTAVMVVSPLAAAPG